MKWTPGKSILLYFIIIGGVAFFTPKKIDWSPSYSNEHDRPYGSSLVYERLPDLFPNLDIVENKTPIYNTYRDSLLDASSFIFINSSMEFDSLDLSKLLFLVDGGTNVFIGADRLGDELLDTLDLDVNFHYPVWSQDSVKQKFTEIDFGWAEDDDGSSFTFKGSPFFAYFENNDSLENTLKPIGWFENEDINVFVEKPFGNGKFYLHSIPTIFTNYHLLYENNHEYIENVFSYLPMEDVYWDEYYKDVKNRKSKSIFHVVLAEKALKWVYWISILSIFLFMLFHAKRRQRMIPVIEPPKNESVDFVENVSSIYFQKSDHRDLALKKIEILKEYIQRKFYMRDIIFSKEQAHLLSMKSNHPIEFVESLFKDIMQVKEAEQINSSSLKKINKQINQFYDRK